MLVVVHFYFYNIKRYIQDNFRTCAKATKKFLKTELKCN